TTPTATAASASTSFASLLASAESGSSSSAGTSPAATAQTLDSLYGEEALSSLASVDDPDGASASATDPFSSLGLPSALSALSGSSLLDAGSASDSSTLAATSADATSALSGLASLPTSGADGNQQIVQIAEGQVGQTEEPFGSNDGPAISMYRSAVAGAEAGEPWCAQFASWVAKQAGIPLGDEGQGFSAVSEIWQWAQQTGRAIPNGPGVRPQPGDLIVFGDAHVGIVTGVEANGDIDTVEGNFDNQVMRNVRGPDEATGYVDMNE
ncbi:MAG TPA: CHAP domain-containing protein, partial [Solirubrobacteraceae bacterium]|nr:CHAP domain-containing protein [Solirubrobacteraceae bacterium]